MRVAVDARQAYRADRRGIGRTLVNLVRALAAARPAWEFRLFHQEPAADDPFTGLANVVRRQITVPASYRFDLWERLRLPLAAWAARADVLFCPANTGPGRTLTPLLLMVHDMIPADDAPAAPQTHEWLRRVGRAARVARRVYTPSEYSRGRIVAHLGLSPEKVVAVPSAADPAVAAAPDGATADGARARYGLAAGRPFVFGFAAADPRKNTARIIEAWSLLPAALRARFDLLMVGAQEPALSEFRRLAAKLLPDGGCHLHGFVAEADVPVLLAAADLLCYPSLNEGFGLPVLDGFRAGTAVLTGNATSLPEVAGDAAVLADPHSAASIAAALERVLSDDTGRAARAVAGRERERQFTWERTAARVAALIEETAR